MVAKPELQNRNGTAPAPGAVFRARAENTCDAKCCGNQETFADRKRWPRGRVQQRPGRACSPVGLSAAFTLVDLLAIIGVLAVGFALLTPALARTQPNSKTFQCLNNLRQLGRAWLMYADDNNERIVGAYHGGDAYGGAAASDPTKAPWALGWQDWSPSGDNTNVLFLTDDKYSRLAKYLDHSRNVFKCPSDQFISIAQRQAGYKERVRSVSGNIGVGEGNAETGPWDVSTYLHIKTMSGFQYPGASGTWIFLDENADSINDPSFFNPRVGQWLDFPATYHNGATSLAFADGHTELHKWKASMSSKAYQGAPIWDVVRPGPPASATDVDTGWMRYHGGRISDNLPNLVP